jgi:predicted negative regulator of RcsB-dependent stress response
MKEAILEFAKYNSHILLVVVVILVVLIFGYIAYTAKYGAEKLKSSKRVLTDTCDEEEIDELISSIKSKQQK